MVRAVVTGLGCVTPIGQSVAEFWSNLTSGVSGVKRITLFDASDQDCQIAAEVKDWDPTRFMESKAAKRAARFSQFAVAAARQAVADSSAAGAVSALTAVLAIRDGVIPPTINLETPDPECDLDYTALLARQTPVRIALANGFGFGGQNGVIAFKQFEDH